MEAHTSFAQGFDKAPVDAHWTRHALNYRIPRRGPNYTLFSIFVDSLCAVIAPIILFSILSAVSAELITFNISLWIVIACVLLTRLITFNALQIYSVAEQPRFITEITTVSMAVLISVLEMLGVFYLTGTTLATTLLIALTVLAFVTHVGWRSIVYFWSYYSAVRRILAPERVVIVGATQTATELTTCIHRFPLPTTRVVGYLDDNLTGSLNDVPIIGKLDDNIFEIIREYNVDALIFAASKYSTGRQSDRFANLNYVPLSVYSVPNYLKLDVYTSKSDSLENLPLLKLNTPAIPFHKRVIKRTIDISVALVGLLLVLPCFAIIALAIRFYDGGPVFFKQERYGENGKMFNMLKFRSMVVNADKMVDQVMMIKEDGTMAYKLKNDPRITPIGQIIRKTSLDELPQLINILRGDMSIVGPRPEVRRIVENEYDAWQYERMRVPQGLTGWWQVNGRSEKECYTDTEKDIYYVHNYSLWLDLKIILMTVPALFKGKGAY